MTPDALRDLVVNVLEEYKAVDVVALKVSDATVITDYMIIASGRSNRQVNSIADKIMEAAKLHHYDILGEEGKKQGDWVLVDLGDVIVHVMHPETREYYQLEKLWQDTEKKAERS